jgi:hypothetical protein
MPDKKRERKEKEAKEIEEIRKDIKKPFPVGMILILIYLGFGFIGYISNLFKGLGIIGPWIFTGLPGIVLYAFLLIISLALFIGILKRKDWARDLGIFFYIALLIWGVVNILFLITTPGLIDRFLQISMGQQAAQAGMEFVSAFFLPMMIISAVVGIVLNILVIWYLKKRKDFFVK